MLVFAGIPSPGVLYVTTWSYQHDTAWSGHGDNGQSSYERRVRYLKGSLLFLESCHSSGHACSSAAAVVTAMIMSPSALASTTNFRFFISIHCYRCHLFHFWFAVVDFTVAVAFMSVFSRITNIVKTSFRWIHIYFFQPLLQIFKGIGAGDIVHQNNPMRTSIIGRRQCSESFLSSRIPNGQFHTFVIHI